MTGTPETVPPKTYTTAHYDALSAEIRWVTPELARQIRDTCEFERQRAVAPNQVARLSAEMSRTWFLQGTPIWFCVLPDGSMTCVNGNHTLEAVAASKVNIPLTFIYQKVASIEEAATSYACFDIQRTRTWANAAQAAGIDKLVPLSEQVLTALGVVMGEFNYNPKKHADILQSRPLRFALAEEYSTAAALLKGATEGSPAANQKAVKRAAIFAVALVTARYQPAIAEAFWHDLVFDDGLRSNDPRKTLLNYLLRYPGTTGWGRVEQSRACALAWNAYFERRDLQYIKPNQALSFSLAGTPWAAPKRPNHAKKMPTETTDAKLQKTKIKETLIIGKRIVGDGREEDVAIFGR